MDSDRVYFRGDTQNRFIIVDHKNQRVERRYQIGKLGSSDVPINRLFFDNELSFLHWVKQTNQKHFVHVLEYSIQEDGLAVISIEYVRGVPLDTIIYSRVYSYTANTIVNYLSQISMALDFMHENGYVHGSIKAMSIMVSTDGVLKLTNFKKTMLKDKHLEATLISTYLPYRAPELLDPSSTMWPTFDQKFDVFSAGIVLWEMVMRRRLDIDEIFLQAEAENKRIPDLPCRREFSEIFDYCTAWSPIDRCTSRQVLEYFQELDKRGTFAGYDVEPTVDWSRDKLDNPEGVLLGNHEKASFSEIFDDIQPRQAEIRLAAPRSTQANCNRDLYLFWTKRGAQAVAIGLPSFFDDLDVLLLDNRPAKASGSAWNSRSSSPIIRPRLKNLFNGLESFQEPQNSVADRRPTLKRQNTFVNEVGMPLGQEAGQDQRTRVNSFQEEQDRLLFGGSSRCSQQALSPVFDKRFLGKSVRVIKDASTRKSRDRCGPFSFLFRKS